MNDIELYILTLYYAGYTIDYTKTIVNTDNIDNIINKYSKFELIDGKKNYKFILEYHF